MFFDCREDARYTPGAVIAIAGVVIGEVSLPCVLIARAVPAKIEDEQVPFASFIEQFDKRALDMVFGCLAVAEIRRPVVGYPRIPEVFDELTIATIFLALRERTPDVRVLPFEQSRNEHARFLSVPIELDFCICSTSGAK